MSAVSRARYLSNRRRSAADHIPASALLRRSILVSGGKSIRPQNERRSKLATGYVAACQTPEANTPSSSSLSSSDMVACSMCSRCTALSMGVVGNEPAVILHCECSQLKCTYDRSTHLRWRGSLRIRSSFSSRIRLSISRFAPRAHLIQKSGSSMSSSDCCALLLALKLALEKSDGWRSAGALPSALLCLMTTVRRSRMVSMSVTARPTKADRRDQSGHNQRKSTFEAGQPTDLLRRTFAHPHRP